MHFPRIETAEAQASLDRLIEIAFSDTGQARRVANFLLSWWNGEEQGGFDIADLFSVDRAISDDMTTIFAYLGQHPGAVYPDAFGHGASIAELIGLWRRVSASADTDL